MSFEIEGIDHVVLYAADQEATVRFYEDVLGCRVLRRNPKVGLVHLCAGSSMIDILPAPEGAPRGRNVDHVALRITPFEAEALTRHLEGFGLAPTEVKDRFGAGGTGPSLTLEDPDGTVIELKGPASD